MYIASAVIAIGMLIFMIFVSGAVEFTGISSIDFALTVLLAAIMFPIEACGIMLNWKKILKGFIAPIPILSYFIQCFVSFWYAIKALISIIKHQDLVIGKPVDEDDE